MTTNETYIARLRKLISEAPDGLDVGPLEVHHLLIEHAKRGK